jgi:hypothetical protein
MSAGAELDAGSFPDPDSRGCTPTAQCCARSASAARRTGALWRPGRLFRAAPAEGRLVATEEVTVTKELPLLRTERSAAVLRHERMPFVSCPYEWMPRMLRGAALLQLDPLLAVLDQDLAATPEGTHPGYGEALFGRMLGQAFVVARRDVLPSGTRVLYHALPL